MKGQRVISQTCISGVLEYCHSGLSTDLSRQSRSSAQSLNRGEFPSGNLAPKSLLVFSDRCSWLGSLALHMYSYWTRFRQSQAQPWLAFQKGGCSYDCLSEPSPLKATSRIHFSAGSVSSTRPTLGQRSPLTARLQLPLSYHFPKPLLAIARFHKLVFLLVNSTQHSAKTMSSGPPQLHLFLTQPATSLQIVTTSESTSNCPNQPL
ncbi:hypothetical protein BGZ61DRAFT_178374 [Ilyonectria robusta]|uniref:uncharacterized protein n=1 Tax=Ilyonectria robusta TaxID=1079257 RepID=UPI001E8D4BB5|nr:uncharacterized protein BGZ61DRAFT_178374 [Ilyonectria robusta]KAH8729239.1 hypothetical protein BGZ61DRAFT_178374 [Ilyonectria robusta]